MVSLVKRRLWGDLTVPFQNGKGDYKKGEGLTRRACKNSTKEKVFKLKDSKLTLSQEEILCCEGGQALVQVGQRS